MSLYLTLFWIFFKIGLFGFGGGYAIAALIQDEIVYKHAWLTVSQFTDIMAISQVTPGPIAINCATYVGYAATNSIWGAAIATFASCLGPFILVSLVVIGLQKIKNNPYVEAAFTGIRPAVIGLIASAALMLANGDNFIDLYSYLIFGIVALASLAKANPIILLVLSGIAGYFLY
ncbi:MAG: chromate transporter [Paludibacteraceae bacterium]|nr:chromate transporter [Paludibacteraceae bacterium]MEE1174420.1 chromate transporter [Paludibacteraceae bacterium]